MADTTGAIGAGEDGRRRCAWSLSSPEYVSYHDLEWARPVVDDVRLYEKVCLEGFQAGLAWITILRKRDAFRAAFEGFEPAQVARFGDRDVARLLDDAGIVRHRGKIEAAIANARATLDVQAECGSLAGFVWQFAPTGRRKAPAVPGDVPAKTPESIAMSKALV
jgi:DNA-3-methyladenine glycosylase I